MTDLSHVKELVALDHGLSVVVTLRPDHTPQTSVVNAGVMTHPVTGAEVVAFVAAGRARKLAHLRADPTITVVVRAGWQWVAVEGTRRVDRARRPASRRRRRATAGPAPRDLHRSRRNPRRLGHLRPCDARGATNGGARNANPHVLEPRW